MRKTNGWVRLSGSLALSGCDRTLPTPLMGVYAWRLFNFLSAVALALTETSRRVNVDLSVRASVLMFES